MPQIRVKTGRHQGQTFQVEGNKPILIGRDPKTDLQVPDKGVSREHARIYRVGEMVFIRDLGSRNGTFVNTEAVREELLREGDLIRVGSTQLVFESTRASQARPPGVEFEEGETLKSSLELRLDELLSDSSSVLAAPTGDHFRALCQALNIALSERDERKLLDALLGVLEEHVPAGQLYVFLRDPASGAITPQAMRQKEAAGTATVSRTILKRVIAEARAILSADARQDERLRPGDSILLHQIRSVLCVPIPGPAGVLGAIYAVNAGMSETFHQPDLELFAAAAAQLGSRLGQKFLLEARQGQLVALARRLLDLAPAGPRTAEHAERVARTAGAIARELGLLEYEMHQAHLAGLLHDVGKTADAPALGAGQPPDHPQRGAERLSGIAGLEAVAEAVAAHHERLDGTGFPKALKADAIPMAARIVSVANAFDHLFNDEAEASGEPAGLRLRRAFAALEEQSGSAFDAEVIRALVIAHRHGALPIGAPAAVADGQTPQAGAQEASQAESADDAEPDAGLDSGLEQNAPA